MGEHSVIVAMAVATADQQKPATPTIDEIVQSYVDDQDQQRQERFNVFTECIRDGAVTVSNENQASEIARLMNQADADLENTQAIAAAMVARAAARVKNLAFLFSMPLEIWTSVKLAGKKTRSMILPGGKLSLRHVPETIRTEDGAAVLAWAQQELPTAVEMVPKLKTEVLKEYEQLSGGLIPGRLKTPAHDSFTVSVPKPK